jgi:hypothetical protein
MQLEWFLYHVWNFQGQIGLARLTTDYLKNRITIDLLCKLWLLTLCLHRRRVKTLMIHGFQYFFWQSDNLFIELLLFFFEDNRWWLYSIIAITFMEFRVDNGLPAHYLFMHYEMVDCSGLTNWCSYVCVGHWLMGNMRICLLFSLY